MKIKHGLALSSIVLIALVLAPSSVTLANSSVFSAPVTVVIDSVACGDVYARYHALTIDNPIPRTFWKGEWYEENTGAIIGVSSGSFHYEETFDLSAGQHVLEYVVSVPPSYANWSATIRINGVVVASGIVSLDEHVIISFDVVVPEHELTVALDAPSVLNLGGSSLLEATVTNRGLSNETDVELFLLVDGAVVGSVTIPELLTDSSYTLNYLWTPTVERLLCLVRTSQQTMSYPKLLM
ncbi:MAG: CARDB domain-containing protein [Candidatus Hermodarchaeia archaeon]|jgi:hypothetical protein